MNKTHTKAIIAIAAFLILSSALSLTFKHSAVLTWSNDLSKQMAAADTAVVTYQGKDALHVESIDLDKASKESGLSKDIIKQFAKQISAGMAGSCISSIGSVTVSHSMCTPAGAGRCMGVKGDGKDFCPCPVSGTQGGSVTAICWKGCCRAVSASSPNQALSGLSQGQQSLLGVLGQSLSQFLGQMMQSGGGGGGYNYPNYDYGDNKYDSITDTTLDTSTNDNNFDYLNTDPGTSVVTDNENLDLAPTQLVDEKDQTPEDLVETVLTEKERQEVAQTDTNNGYAKPIRQVTQEQVSQNTEIDEINKSEIYNYEFQNINRNKDSNDPRLAQLRDPDKSSVAKLRYKNRDADLDYLPKPEELQKSWWQKLLDWILGN